jgi:hypothetical protein
MIRDFISIFMRLLTEVIFIEVYMEGYMTIKQAAKKWDVTPRRIQKLCTDGRIEGATKFGRDWAIPADATKPEDKRVTTGEYRNWRKKSSGKDE